MQSEILKTRSNQCNLSLSMNLTNQRWRKWKVWEKIMESRDGKVCQDLFMHYLRLHISYWSSVLLHMLRLRKPHSLLHSHIAFSLLICCLHLYHPRKCTHSIGPIDSKFYLCLDSLHKLEEEEVIKNNNQQQQQQPAAIKNLFTIKVVLLNTNFRQIRTLL